MIKLKFLKYSYYLIFLLLLFIFKSPLSYAFKNINSSLIKDDYNKNVIKSLKTENKSLKKELKEISNFKINDYNRFDYQSSKIIERNMYNFYDYLIIDKGNNNNIKLNMPVVCSDGLIGVIKKTNKFNSKVQLLSSSYSKISIKINDVYGSISKYDKNKDMYQAIVTKSNNIKKKDKIYTSGLGTIPENIYVGEVVKIASDDLNTIIYFKTSYNINNLNSVLILRGNKNA